MDDVDAIVAGLSKAMRLSLVNAVEPKFMRGTWLPAARDFRTVNALDRRNLLDDPCALNSLGMLVRSRLMGQSPTEATPASTQA